MTWQRKGFTVEGLSLPNSNCMPQDLGHKKIKLNMVTFEKGPVVTWWQYCGGRREALILHQQKVTSLKFSSC